MKINYEPLPISPENKKVIEKYTKLLEEAETEKKFWDLLHRYLITHKEKIDDLGISIESFFEE